MGEKWRQLKYEDRLQLDICLKGKMKIPDIAKLLHVAKTTIYREIKRGRFTKRNSDWTESEVYDPYVAVIKKCLTVFDWDGSITKYERRRQQVP